MGEIFLVALGRVAKDFPKQALSNSKDYPGDKKNPRYAPTAM
jgi:hypothetical protein